MVRVLFVCMGNICRSPMAEGVFRQLAADAGLLDSGIATDSAGTSRYHVGEPPDARAVRKAREAGLDISAQRARQVERSDFGRFDYVVAMDRDNLRHLEQLAPKEDEQKLSLLMDHARDCFVDEVPDPYFGGEEGFTRCLELIRLGAAGLLERVLTEHFPERAAERQQA